MNAQRLVAMANDIAAFFASEPDPSAAAAGVAHHLTRFWDPRMRREIVEYYRAAGGGLSPIAAAAVSRLASEPAPEAR